MSHEGPMAAITLEQAQAQLTAWLDCSVAVARNQSYTINVDGADRTYTRANAAYILDQIRYWRSEVDTLIAAATAGNSGSQMIFAGRVR